MRVAITNIGTIVSGDWRVPLAPGDTIVTQDDKIASVGTASANDVERCDVVIDAGGTTAIPGLINSHVHITFGDYTPRQQTVGYLESYVHGGVTTAISASEVHVPGRPRDADGVKALAVAAHKCFEHYRPGGMTVHAGSIILEPGLTGNDLGEVAKLGVWLAKAGFGAFANAYEYAPLIAAAHAHDMITTVHTGGSSIPGSGAITGDHLLALQAARLVPRQWRPDRDAGPRLRARDPRQRDRAADLHRRQPAHRAAVREPCSKARRFRSAAHRHGYADRKRHHAARHALHHRSPLEPRRPRARGGDRGGDRQ